MLEPEAPKKLTLPEAIAKSLAAASNGLIDADHAVKKAEVVIASLRNNGYEVIEIGDNEVPYFDNELAQLLSIANQKSHMLDAYGNVNVQEQHTSKLMTMMLPKLFGFLYSDHTQYDLKCNAFLTVMAQSIASMFMRAKLPEAQAMANVTSTFHNLEGGVRHMLSMMYIAQQPQQIMQPDMAANGNNGKLRVN